MPQIIEWPIAEACPYKIALKVLIPTGFARDDVIALLCEGKIFIFRDHETVYVIKGGDPDLIEFRLNKPTPVDPELNAYPVIADNGRARYLAFDANRDPLFAYLDAASNFRSLDAADTTRFTVERLSNALTSDPWLRNKVLNLREESAGETILTTYPIDLTLPITDFCNSRCSFCVSWLTGTGNDILLLDSLKAYEPILRHLVRFGLAGYGEPLIHPHLEEILSYLITVLDRRTQGYIITNGVNIDKYLEQLLNSHVVTINISLNAASADTHMNVMGLPRGSFNKILNSIKNILKHKNSDKSQLNMNVNISMVLTAHNIHEVADFVCMGNRLGVTGIYLRTLVQQSNLMPGLNYHTLPPYLNPDFQKHKARALEAISASSVPITCAPESWDKPVFPSDIEINIANNPPHLVTRKQAIANYKKRKIYSADTNSLNKTRGRFIRASDDDGADNLYGRAPRIRCKTPYNNLIFSLSSNIMHPCCYMANVPGYEPVFYDGSYDIFEAWNSPAFIELRRRLKEGPLFRNCLECPSQF